MTLPALSAGNEYFNRSCGLWPAGRGGRQCAWTTGSTAVSPTNRLTTMLAVSLPAVSRVELRGLGTLNLTLTVNRRFLGQLSVTS